MKVGAGVIREREIARAVQRIQLRFASSNRSRYRPAIAVTVVWRSAVDFIRRPMRFREERTRDKSTASRDKGDRTVLGKALLRPFDNRNNNDISYNKENNN